MKHLQRLLALAVIFGSSACADDSSPHVDALREFCGGPARFVWVQGDKSLLYTTNKSRVALMGLDTEDGKGERRLLPEDAAYSKPLLTEDGRHVVYSDRKKRTCHVIGFDGRGARDLGSGFASDIWTDPKSGVVWVYLRSGRGNKEDPVVRRRLDDPSVEEPVWSKTETGHAGVPWFQLSADGRYFAEAFPWPNCGLGDMKSGKHAKLASGCWPAMIPDNSYRSWIFLGNHREIQVFDHGAKKGRSIDLGRILGKSKTKVYHPHQTKHPRFLTVTAPERNPESELYLGKFDSKWRSVEGWIRVTHNNRAEMFGDAWLKSRTD